MRVTVVARGVLVKRAHETEKHDDGEDRGRNARIVEDRVT